MNNDSFLYAALEELKDRRNKLDSAIDTLEPLTDEDPAPQVAAPKNNVITMKRRTMSPAARKRIAMAMKARWRAAKRDGRSTLAA